MANVWLKCGRTVNLFASPGVTVTGAGPAHYKDGVYTTFQATVTGTGAVTASVDIEVSNDGTNWCDTELGTISLTGTTSATDGLASSASWKYVRANVTAITGTGATVQVIMGV